MLTIEQKAGAWDGLKDSIMEMVQSPRYSIDCKNIANEFLLMMREVELKVEGHPTGTTIEMPGEATPVVVFDGPRRFETRSGILTDVNN